MKNIKKVLIAAILVVIYNGAFAQNTTGTIAPGNANDPMVVNPGTTADSMTVKPGKTNDEIAAFTDTGFIGKNIHDNMMEINLAKAGLAKGTSQQVKKVATLMVREHTLMLNDLKKLALKKGVSLKDYSHDMASTDDMNISSGKDFDKTWATEMLTMHEAKIAELESYISLATDEDIKAVATKALPKVKMHRDMLMKISGARAKNRIA